MGNFFASGVAIVVFCATVFGTSVSDISANEFFKFNDSARTLFFCAVSTRTATPTAWRHVFDGAWRETSLAAAAPGGGAFVQVWRSHAR